MLVGMICYVVFSDSFWSSLDKILRWFFLIGGLSFVATGLIAIFLREFPVRDGTVYRNSEAIALGIIFIVLGSMVGIILFLKF
jgi:hypothetical protein